MLNIHFFEGFPKGRYENVFLKHALCEFVCPLFTPSVHTGQIWFAHVQKCNLRLLQISWETGDQICTGGEIATHGFKQTSKKTRIKVTKSSAKNDKNLGEMITKSSHSNDDDDDDVVRKIKADQVLCYSFNANGPYGIRLKNDWNQFFHQNCTGVDCTAFLHTAIALHCIGRCAYYC